MGHPGWQTSPGTTWTLPSDCGTAVALPFCVQFGRGVKMKMFRRDELLLALGAAALGTALWIRWRQSRSRMHTAPPSGLVDDCLVTECAANALPLSAYAG